MAQILIVDDNQKIRRMLSRALCDYRIETAVSGKEALLKISSNQFHAVLLDVVLPDANDLELLKEIKKLQPFCHVIVMTGYASITLAVEAIKIGAYDFIEKPFTPSIIRNLIKKAIDESGIYDGCLPENVSVLADSVGFVGRKSKEVQDLLLTAYKVAGKDLSILIHGETGAGKEYLARFIHLASLRSRERFFPVNCGAFIESLAESELFGHEKGAFTGADRLRRGCFELADKGTIFLDEIGDASLGVQARLLRILETGEFQRVGGESLLTTDVRVLAATNIDLMKEVKKKLFREDLYYRLGVVCLHIPPLRKRRDDILPLAQFFLQRTAEPGRALVLSPEVVQILLNYAWPGNVRELANAIQQAAALAEDGTILPDHLPSHLRQHTAKRTPRKEKNIPPSMAECEKRAIEAALEYCHGNIPKAASVLGIGQATLYRKINKYLIMVDRK